MEVTGFLNKNRFSGVLGMKAWTEFIQEKMGGGRLGTVTVDNYFKICRLKEGKKILPGGQYRVNFFFFLLKYIVYIE